MSKIKEILENLAYTVNHPVLAVRSRAEKYYANLREEAEVAATRWDAVPALKDHYQFREASIWIVCVSILLFWPFLRGMSMSADWGISTIGLTLTELVAGLILNFLLILTMLLTTVGPVMAACSLMLSVIADEKKARQSVKILLMLAFALMLLEPVLQITLAIDGVSVATGTLSTTTLAKLLPLIGLIGLAIGACCMLACWVVQTGATIHWWFVRRKAKAAGVVGITNVRRAENNDASFSEQNNEK